MTPNQAAISCGLMNELQTVRRRPDAAATVTEDINSAIADSVNYTVEEPRTWQPACKSTAAEGGTDDVRGTH
jgi:twitching motility protein PilJ